jgi:hypothetical protein
VRQDWGDGLAYQAAHVIFQAPGRDVISFGASGAGSFDGLTWISQCAQTARIISGGRFHPESCRFGLVADERPTWVTGWAEAS